MPKRGMYFSLQPSLQPDVRTLPIVDQPSPRCHLDARASPLKRNHYPDVFGPHRAATSAKACIRASDYIRPVTQPAALFHAAHARSPTPPQLSSPALLSPFSHIHSLRGCNPPAQRHAAYRAIRPSLPYADYDNGIAGEIGETNWSQVLLLSVSEHCE